MDEVGGAEDPGRSILHDMRVTELTIVELSEEQIRRIPQPYRALLVGTSFVTNEILCFTRLLLLTLNSSKLSDEPAVKAMLAANMGAINRALSGKVVEFLNLVSAFEGRNAGSQEPLAKKLGLDILSDLKALRKSRAFKLADEVRNHVSHHYSFADFVRYSDTFGYGVTGMWLAEMEGNSTYQLGEDIVNVGLFSKYDDVEIRVAEWVDWTRDASGLISTANGQVAIAIAEAYLPDLAGTARQVVLPKALFASVDSTSMPLFWFRSNAMGR